MKLSFHPEEVENISIFYPFLSPKILGDQSSPRIWHFPRSGVEVVVSADGSSSMAWRAFVRLPRQTALARCRPAARPGDEGDPLRLLATGAVSLLGVGGWVFSRERERAYAQASIHSVLRRSGAPRRLRCSRRTARGFVPVPRVQAQRVLRVRETIEGTLPAGEGV